MNDEKNKIIHSKDEKCDTCNKTNSHENKNDNDDDENYEIINTKFIKKIPKSKGV
tara:strand:+ start:363 stop:527 length:165 start_codon:yes stop_codon:yes gene_type:complete